jgi:xanthine/uracil permease
MVAAVGISVLQFIDFSSTRNLTILALSLILGIMIPEWLASQQCCSSSVRVGIILVRVGIILVRVGTILVRAGIILLRVGIILVKVGIYTDM